MEISAETQCRAFAGWLRTGYWPPVGAADGTELKFNPCHDPANGRFTFAPGGGASSPTAHQARPPSRPVTTAGRGGNSRAFEDPMTLEHAFPGLERASPSSMIFAVADNLLDLTGPATEAQIALLDTARREVVSQIKAIAPNWHYAQLVR